MALTKISGSILKDPLNLGEVSIGGTLTYEDVTNIDSVGIITARTGIKVLAGGINAVGVVTATSLTINDYIYHHGDTNTFIGFESNDTIRFNTNGSDKLKINSSGHLILADDNDTYIHHPAADSFAITTGGNERLRINSTGAVIIANKLTNSASYTSHNANFYGGNVNTGGVRIEVAHSTTSVSGNTASGSFPHHLLLSNYSGTGSADNRMCSIGFDIPTTSTHANAVIAYQATAAGTGDLQFHLESGNSISEKLRITSGGNVVIGHNAANAKLHIASGTSSAVGDATNPALQIGSTANYRFAIRTTNEQAIIANKNGDDGIAFHTKAANSGSFGEALRITSSGQLLVNATTINAGGAAPRMAIDVGDSNLHGITIQAGGGESNGDLAGIAFGHGNTGEIARPKAAIAHNRTTSYGVGDLCFYVDGAGDNNAVSSGDERLRITADGNAVFTDKDSGHIGGGFYSRTKSVTGGTTNNFMRFTLVHGALAGAIYLTCSNNAYSISKSYTFAVQYGDGSNVNLQSDSGPMGGVDFIVSCSTSASTHTFRVQNVGGATVEVNLTVVVGCANQDITYTEL